MRRVFVPLAVAALVVTAALPVLTALPVAGADGPGRAGWSVPDPAAVAPAGADTSTIIDTSDRAAVTRAFRERFLPSIGVRTGWTGSVAACRTGATTARYQRAARTLVNYYRGLAGLSGVEFRDTLSAKTQAAALIMDANNGLSHAPPRSWRCWTAAGKEGAGHSNICICESTAGAIEGYIVDPGASNRSVGHRRWILFPPQRVMGVGATPQANALWVLDQASWENADGDPEWVSWPPRGFIPTRHIHPRFSLSHPSADFSDAGVKVVIDGRETAVKVIARDAFYGGPAIVFQPDLDRLIRSDPRKDHVIRVTVRNIKVGAQTLEHTWRTTTIYAYGG